MIRISADLETGHFSLVVEGHEFGMEDGRVCAAVSAITSTALLGLEQTAQLYPDVVSIEIRSNE